MDFGIAGEYIRQALDGVCPILGTVNLRRRNTDTGDSSNAFKAILARTAASTVVAIIVGLSAGMLSAYIMVQVMQERLDAQERQIIHNEESSNYRFGRIEDRLNKHLDQSRGHD